MIIRDRVNIFARGGADLELSPAVTGVNYWSASNFTAAVYGINIAFD
jgi:hypothetical protein